jgi:uncharacterized membrane protein
VRRLRGCWWRRTFYDPHRGNVHSRGYDLVYDAIGATAHNWYSYDHPRGALGVPLTNYLGWLLTGWFWLSTTAQVFNNLIHPTDGVVVRGGKTIAIADVYESCASAALFTIIFTGITALIRHYSQPRQPLTR